MVHRHQVQRRGDEHAEQARHAPAHGVVQVQVVPPVQAGLHDQEHRQPPAEREHDEQRGQQCRLVGLACHQEAEDRAGAGGEHEAPHQRRHAGRLGPAVPASLEHRPQVHDDDRGHARVEEHVPGEHRAEVVVGGRHDHAVGAAQVEHQHHQAAAQQRQREQPRQRRARLVHRLAEHRADRGHVQHARGGHDHEDRKHVRQAPHHLVVHAGDDVAVRLHVVRGSQAEAATAPPRATSSQKLRALGSIFMVYSPW